MVKHITVFLCSPLFFLLFLHSYGFTEDFEDIRDKEVFHLNQTVLEAITELNAITASDSSSTNKSKINDEHVALVNACISRLDSGDIRQLQLFIALLEQSILTIEPSGVDRYWANTYRYAIGQVQLMLVNMPSDEARDALLELKRQYGRDGGASLIYKKMLVQHEIKRGVPFAEACKIHDLIYLDRPPRQKAENPEKPQIRLRPINID